MKGNTYLTAAILSIVLLMACSGPGKLHSSYDNKTTKTDQTAKNQGLQRKILKYGPSEDLLAYGPQNGTVVVHLCIGRNGEILSSEINHDKTSIQHPGVHATALKIMDQFVFAADESAPEIECNDYTFRMRSN